MIGQRKNLAHSFKSYCCRIRDVIKPFVPLPAAQQGSYICVTKPAQLNEGDFQRVEFAVHRSCTSRSSVKFTLGHRQMLFIAKQIQNLKMLCFCLLWRVIWRTIHERKWLRATCAKGKHSGEKPGVCYSACVWKFICLRDNWWFPLTSKLGEM